MDLTGVIAFILDQPALQEPGAAFIAGALKAKLPGAIDKDIGDFLMRVGAKLGGTAPAA